MKSVRKDIMLAKPFQEQHVSRWPKKVYAQPKFRGQRGWFDVNRRCPELISSFGIPFQFQEHLISALMELPQVFYDGELYNHSMGQEQITSICNRTVQRHPKSDQIEYHIFDLKIANTPQSYRLQALMGLASMIPSDSPIKICPTELILLTDWQQYATKWLDQGYEGLILRHPDGRYVSMSRKWMLKFKPTEKDEYLIIDIIEAKAVMGVHTGLVGSFLVRSADSSVSFYVGAGKLAHSRRKEIMLNKQKYLGKLLIVKHEPITTNTGIPICAVAVNLIA